MLQAIQAIAMTVEKRDPYTAGHQHRVAQLVTAIAEEMGLAQGLTGDAILLDAQIMAVADVVEAMSTHRPYRPALGIAAAIAGCLARGLARDLDNLS